MRYFFAVEPQKYGVEVFVYRGGAVGLRQSAGETYACLKA